MSVDDCPIDWVDEYVARLRDHIFVREEDCLLIKVPNEAHRLNPSGARLLKRLIDGETVEQVWQSHGATDAVRRDIYAFFVALKPILLGRVSERNLPEAVVKRPFALGFSKLPVLSEVALTYRCNLSCRFCYAGCSCQKRPAEVELATDDVRRILRIIRDEAQVPSVSFTGGEPTLRDDLCDLVAYARELSLRVNLITNGTRVDGSLAAALRQAGLNSAQVSLESPVEAVHDQLTQVAGSFERTVKGLCRLRDEGISVHTNATLTTLNVDSIFELPRFVRSLDLDRFSLNLMIPMGTGAGAGAHSLPLRYEQLPEVLDRLQRESRLAGVRFMWYSPTPLCIYNPIAKGLGNKGCAACDGLLSVSPSGDVLPCSSWPEPVGNLLRDTFRVVWSNAQASRIRGKEEAPDVCGGCEDFAACQGACPLYWRRFGCDELEGRRTRHAVARS